jgi:Na+/proline symporter
MFLFPGLVARLTPKLGAFPFFIWYHDRDRRARSGRRHGDCRGQPLWPQHLPGVSYATDERVATVSKRTSLVVKIGAVAVLFIVVAPAKYVVNFQLAGGVWILQTLRAVFLALSLRRLDRWAILADWAAGIAAGTAMLAETGFEDATRHFGVLGSGRVYVALPALALNLAVVFAGTGIAGFLRRATEEPAPSLGA